MATRSSVLKSERALEVNMEIMRAFVCLRQMLASHTTLARKLEELEEGYDGRFRVVLDTIRRLMAPSKPPQRRIGFQNKE